MRNVRLSVAIGVVLAVLGLSSCGQSSLPGESQPTSTPSITNSSAGISPLPPEGATALPAHKVDTTALPPENPRLVWTQDGGNVVGVHGKEGGCSTSRLDLTEQTSQLVRLTVVEITPARPEICTMDIRFPPLTAKLASPLGERIVVLVAKKETR